MLVTEKDVRTAEGLVPAIWRLLLAAFPYFLIFNLKVSNGIIILLAVTALIYRVKERDWSIDFRMLIWCSSLFLLTVFACLYTSDFKQGLADIDSRLPLILFPIAFALKPVSDDDQKIVLKHFYLSLILTFIVLLTYAVYRNYHGHGNETWFNKWYYHYTDFTEVLKIHPLYLSLYVAFAMLLLILDTMGIQKIFRLRRTVKLSVFFLLTVFMIMLSSRWIILTLVLVIMAILCLSWKNISRIWIVAFFGFLAGLIILVAVFPVTRGRFTGAFSTEYAFSPYSLDRLVIWSVAMDYVRQNPEEFIFGKGTGSSKKLMDRLYKEKNINWEFEQKTNTHNQYLDFLLNMGVIGLSWLVYFLARSLLYFKRRGNWIGIVFILLLSIAMVCENYLQQQKGIAFFGLVYCIALFSHHNAAKHKQPNVSKGWLR